MSGPLLHPHRFSRPSRLRGRSLAISAPPAFSPADIPGLGWWLDADDPATITQVAGAVSAWGDKSGAGRNLTAPGGLEPRIGINTIAGRNVVTFNGTSQYMTRTSFLFDQSRTSGGTLFIAARRTSGTNGRLVGEGRTSAATPIYTVGLDITTNEVLFQHRHNGNVQSLLLSKTYMADATPHIITWTDSGATGETVTMNADGIGATGGVYSDTSGTTLDVLSVGALVRNTIGNYFGGDIMEILWWPRVLTLSEIVQVRSYLAERWGVVTQGIDYSGLSNLLVVYDASLTAASAITAATPDQLDIWGDISGNGRHASSRSGSDAASATQTLNGLNVYEFNGMEPTNGDSYQTAAQVITDDHFDIYAVVRGPANANEAVLAQHAGTAVSGRTVFLGKQDGASNDKARLFFNNGTSYEVLSTTVVWDDQWHLVRVFSDGAGNHGFQIDGGASEGTGAGIGQVWTPLNTRLSIACVQSTTATSVNDAFEGEIAHIVACGSKQSDVAAAGLVEQLVDRWGVAL